MKVKVINLLNAKPAFDKIIESELKPVNSFRIARLIRVISEELELFNQKRNDLITKYGEIKKSEDGKEEVLQNGSPIYFVSPNSENFTKYSEELNALVHAEININTDLLPVSVLDELKLTPVEASYLEVFFDL